MNSIKIPSAFSVSSSLLRIAVPVLLAVGMAGCDFFTSPEARIQEAEARILARDYRGASIELRNALQDQPENGRARRLLAEVSLRLGDAPGAEADLRRAIEFGESPVALADLAARINLALGHYDAVLTSIDAGEYAIEEPGRSLYRGRAMLGSQRFAEARGLFSGLLAANPGSVDVAVGLAEAEAGLGQFDVALERLEDVTRRAPDQSYAWLMRGSLAAVRGQFDTALSSLEKARSVDAGQLSAQQLAMLLGTLIEVRISRGEIAAAEATLQQLTQVFPGAPVTRFMGARIALAKQDFNTAATELQRIVSGAPGFTSARFLLGAVSLAQGRLQQADLHLSQVVQSSPENTEARKLLAQVRMRLDRPDEAVQVLIPAIETGGIDPQVTSLLGNARMQGGQQVAALEKALARSPESPQLVLSLAAAYLRDGDSRKALDLLGKPVALRGGVLRDALNLAALAASQGVSAADVELNRLLRARPDDVDLLNIAAGLFTQRAEFDRARALQARALGLSPDNPATLLSMARLEVAAGNLAVAEGQLEKLLSIDATSAMANIGLADLALRKGDRAGAIKRMEDWLRRSPNEPEARLRLARLYLMENQPGPAQKLIDEAIAASPEPAEGENRAGMLYLELGRYEQAVARFRKAADGNSEEPVYWLNLAQAQLALDQRGGAREAAGRALGLRPEWVPAVGVAALLDIRDGKPQSAIARILALKEKHPLDATVLMLEGDVYLAAQKYSEAATAFDEAFKRRPDSGAALKSYRARFQGRLGDVTEPLARWLAQSPGDFQVRGVLAEAYQLAGQQVRAIQEYEAVIRDGPPSAVALNNLAWLYQQQGNPRAVDIARRAQGLAPASAQVADTYGWILVQNGRAEEGLVFLEQAAKGAADSPDVLYHRAAALARMGRTAESRQALAALLAKQARFESRIEAQRLFEELGGSK